MYPPEMLDIFKAAREQRDYVRVFPAHNLAHAFVCRFYRFRMDAVEVGMPNALSMANFVVTGMSADGQLFDGKNKYVQPPITMTWRHGLASADTAPMRAEEQQHIREQDMLKPEDVTRMLAEEDDRPKLAEESASEQLMRKMFPNLSGERKK